MVVLHHLHLIAIPELSQGSAGGARSLEWWLSDTPLKLATGGAEAVLVFFVLSGLVVALPAIGHKDFSWAAFLSGRMIRLYLPVWASLALGTALIWVVPRHSGTVTAGSWLADSNAHSTSVASLLDQAALTQAAYGVNNVLWSLRWELVFSVLLPLFVALAILVRRLWWVAAVGAVLISAIGAQTGDGALQHIPVFLLGTLLAVRLDAIREWTRARLMRPRARLWGIGLTAASLLVLVSGWLVRPVVPADSWISHVATDTELVGAVGLVVAAISVPPLRRGLESRVAQWFGRISFSLYLVHLPILVTLGFLFGDQHWWLVGVVGVPLALLTAWSFYHAVERPSHRLAQWTTTRVARRIQGMHAPAT